MPISVPISIRRRRIRPAIALLTAAATLAAMATAVPSAVADTAPTVPIYAWGSNTDHEVGNGSGDDQLTPTAITLADGVDPVDVSAGEDFDIAIGSDGQIYTWGDNNYYEDGEASGNPWFDVPGVFLSLPAGAGAPAKVSAGDSFGLALDAKGAVYGWGSNSYGLLGPDTPLTDADPVPLALPGNDTASAIDAGWDTAAVVGTDGKLFTWGSNNDGQLGDGGTTDQGSPEAIALPGGDKAAAVSMGLGFTLALGADGKVFAWGANESGELGDGTNNPDPSPEQVTLPGGEAATAIAAGEDFALALGANGTVYAWGGDDSGQLGDGTTNNSATPAAVPLPGGVSATAVSASLLTSYAVGSDGKLYAWGNNDEGQLGIGSLDDSHTPVQVDLPSATAVQSVSAGGAVFAVEPTTQSRPRFTDDFPPTSAVTGDEYSYQFTATGSPAPVYGLTAGAPSWLSIDPSTGAVTGTVPSGSGEFSYAVTASNNQGTTTTQTYDVRYGSLVPITGDILESLGSAPVSGALVQSCGALGCTTSTSGSDGGYSVTALSGDDTETLQVFPPSGQSVALLSATVGPLTVPAAGLPGEDLTLSAITPLPSNTQIGGADTDGTGAATVNFTETYPLTVTGCANGIGTATIVAQDETTGDFSFQLIPLTETPPGSGTYTGTIPELVPLHGPAQLSSKVLCQPSTDVSPWIGPAAGGTSVLISGSGFTGATAVTFGGVAASSFSVLGDTVIQATTPPGAGTVDVDVTTPAGPDAAAQYTYQGVTALNPSSGPAAGGTQVTITGTGLSNATEVLFGTTPAEFTQVSDSEIQATAPAGQSAVNVSVVTPMGTTASVPGSQYTYSSGSGGSSARTGAVKPTTAKTAAVVASAVRPAISTDTIDTITEIVDKTMPGLITEWNTDKMLSTMQTALKTVNCDNSEAYAKAALELAVTPAVDDLVDFVLPKILIAETAEFAVTLPVLAILLPLTIIAVDLIANYLAGQMIDAAVSAFYAQYCHNTPPAPAPPAFQPNMLIDPSGTVVDTDGNPIPGATATILRADTAAGPFTAVDPGSPGIEPALNPETTDSSGGFHWDVSAGYYEVQATAPGCTDPADPSQPDALIGPYPVPPPQLGLVVTMACANEPPPPTPQVTGLSQGYGPAAGGASVTITGSGFTPTATVDFGGTAAGSVTFDSPTALTAVTPAGSGPVDVTVGTAGGTSPTSPADQYYFGAAPTVTGLSSTGGPTAGGGQVTVTGTGFTGATGVEFGQIPVQTMTVVSDTEIQATVPAGAVGPVDVTVQNPVGISATGAADQYTYSNAAPTGPTVDSLASGTGQTTDTVNAVTSAPGELLVAYVSANGPNRTGQQAKVTGGGLTWTLAGRENKQYGDSEIWTARAPKAGTYPVRAALTDTGYGLQLTVAAYGSSAGIGQVVEANGRTAPSAALTTSAPGSWVFAVGNDWDNSVNRTVGPGQTILAQSTDTVGDTYWVQAQTAPAAGSGTAVTINDTAPTKDRWNFVLVEILGPTS